ncbi:MAG: transcriptional regulator with XRE-family HTH domain [Akkermansiaceae bacterium]|jgi:transcriptional regulator with XRE-family HTH domain
MAQDHFTSPGIGDDLRALRKARSMTLGQVAAHLEKSVGWMSQVERGLSSPTAADIQSLATLYDVPVSMLFGGAPGPIEEQGRIVRATARRRIGHRASGLSEELLSPDLTDSFEVIHSTFQPRSGIITPRKRPTEEIGYLLSGRLILYIGKEKFEIRRGDSFRIRDETYRWENPFSQPACAIWIIAPPVY